MNHYEAELKNRNEVIASYKDTLQQMYDEQRATLKERDELMDTVECMAQQLETAEAQRDQVAEDYQRAIVMSCKRAGIAWGMDVLFDLRLLTDKAVEADELRNQRDRLAQALRAVEWVGMIHFCPWCFRDNDQGHAPDCQRQDALEGVPDERPNLAM